MVWPLTASGSFSVKSLYAKLISGSVASKFKDVWRARIPLNIKKKMWQAIRGRLPAADQIRKRNGPASELCALCGGHEDYDHILFKCDFAALLWSCTRSWLSVNWASNFFTELLVLVKTLSGQLKHIFRFGFTAVC